MSISTFGQPSSLSIKHIDCMEYMKSLGDQVFDLAIVDPPYFSGPNRQKYYGASSSASGVSRKDYGENDTWAVPEQDYFDELLRISKHQIVWGINYYNIKNLGTGRIIWDKCSESSTFSDAEIAYCSLHDSVRLFPYMWNGMMQGISVENGRIVQGNKKLNEVRIHETQKPVKLYQWLLKEYAAKGMRVLDTHLGSGSSAIAAHFFGCEFVGCEIDKKRFERAVKRVSHATSEPKIFSGEIECYSPGCLH